VLHVTSTDTSAATRLVTGLAALVLLAHALCAAPPSQAQTADTTTSPARIFAAAKSWGYQLQKIDPGKLAAAPYDVLVLDYSRDGTDERALTADEVRRLKLKPDGSERLVLAYLSIGEAETYRYYWDERWSLDPTTPTALPPPPWLGRENKKWRGNHGVDYWHEDWQKIIFIGENSYLDRIIRAGFDGVYLDKVDQYVAAAKENAAARALMLGFVAALAERARARKAGFLVVPQNAEELLVEASFRAVIDGFAKEDLLFGSSRAKKANKPEQIEDDVVPLKLLLGERKPVLVVEYIDDPVDVAAARKTLEDYGFVPHFAKRGLDVMRIGDLPPVRPPRPLRGKDKR
jgi:cysteinyl-tRNA synthetase, unknown class